MTVSTTQWRWLLSIGYSLLIVYGTLFPFAGLQSPLAGQWPFQAPLIRDVSMPDVLANVLLYMPFGFFFAMGRRARAIPAIVLGALALSVVLETLQVFLPGRVSSLLDTILNVSGAGAGCVAAVLLRWPDQLGNRCGLATLRRDHVARVGVVALAAWLCAQLMPFVPSLDVGNIKAGLRPLWYALQGRAGVNWWGCLIYVAATTTLTVTGARALRPWSRGGVSAMILFAALPLKVLVVGRQLSPHAFVGTLVGVALGLALWSVNKRLAMYAAAVLVPCYIVGEALRPEAGSTLLHAFNWIPLQAQLSNTISGLANMADSIWPLAALACLCASLGVRRLWPLLPAVALLLSGVEWAQHWIPGRYPGITPILVGLATWVAADLYLARRRTAA